MQDRLLLDDMKRRHARRRRRIACFMLPYIEADPGCHPAARGIGIHAPRVVQDKVRQRSYLDQELWRCRQAEEYLSAASNDL